MAISRIVPTERLWLMHTRLDYAHHAVVVCVTDGRHTDFDQALRSARWAMTVLLDRDDAPLNEISPLLQAAMEEIMSEGA